MFIVLRPKRRTFQVSSIEPFTAEEKSRLRFEFTPYDPRDADSWRVVEISKVISDLAARGVIVRPPPFSNANLPAAPTPLWESRTPSAKIKWSVIIPAYNSARVLPAVIQNLLEQNFSRENFEVIVVDDASEDGTVPLLRKLLEPLAGKINSSLLRIEEPHWESSGKSIYRAGVARNLGYRISSGEFIAFLDSDTVTDRDFLSRYNMQIQKHDLIQSAREYVAFTGSDGAQNYASLANQPRWLEEQEYLAPFYKCDDWLSYPCPWKYVATYALAVKRTHIEELGLFRSTFTSYGFEDVELGYRWWKNGARFYLDKTPVYHLTPLGNQRRGLLNKMFRHYALCNSGKTLFHSTLDLEVFNELYPYMWGESRTLRWLYGRSLKT